MITPPKISAITSKMMTADNSLSLPKTNDIPLLKYFFNRKQKFIIETSLFKDKEEILTLLIKYK